MPDRTTCSRHRLRCPHWSLSLREGSFVQGADIDGEDQGVPKSGVVQLPGLCCLGRVLHASGAGHNGQPGLGHVQLSGRCR